MYTMCICMWWSTENNLFSSFNCETYFSFIPETTEDNDFPRIIKYPNYSLQNVLNLCTILEEKALYSYYFFLIDLCNRRCFWIPKSRYKPLSLWGLAVTKVRRYVILRDEAEKRWEFSMPLFLYGHFYAQKPQPKEDEWLIQGPQDS